MNILKYLGIFKVDFCTFIMIRFEYLKITGYRYTYEQIVAVPDLSMNIDS